MTVFGSGGWGISAPPNSLLVEKCSENKYYRHGIVKLHIKCQENYGRSRGSGGYESENLGGNNEF